MLRDIVLLLVAFHACLLLFYSITPILFNMAGATYFNLSLLASDIYGVVFGVFVFHIIPSPWFALVFCLVIGGILIYHYAAHKQSNAVALENNSCQDDRKWNSDRWWRRWRRKLGRSRASVPEMP